MGFNLGFKGLSTLIPFTIFRATSYYQSFDSSDHVLHSVYTDLCLFCVSFCISSFCVCVPSEDVPSFFLYILSHTSPTKLRAHYYCYSP